MPSYVVKTPSSFNVEVLFVCDGRSAQNFMLSHAVKMGLIESFGCLLKDEKGSTKNFRSSMIDKRSFTKKKMS